MRKYSRTILITIGIFLFVILLEYLTFNIYRKIKREEINISIVLFDDGKDWDNLKAGAELATKNSNAEATLIRMANNSSSEEQLDTIKTEIAGGADKVLVAAGDSERLGELLDGSLRDQVIFVASGIDDKRYVNVSPNNYQMGVDLGLLINNNEKIEMDIAVLDFHDKKTYLRERREGVVTALSSTGRNTEIWEIDAENNIYEQVLKYLNDDRNIAITVTSEEYLEDVMRGISAVSKEVKVYVIGNSDAAVYFLDNKQLEYLIFPDEFGIGYAAVNSVINPKEYKNKNYKNIIRYKIISRPDMYTGEYEKILFPFVK